MIRRIYPIGLIIISLFYTAGVGLCTEESQVADPDILLSAAVFPEAGIVVGQRVILQFDVLAPDGWAQIKRISDFSVEGTQVVRYESQGTRLNETIRGRAFSGQRYQLSIFPGREGTVSVPPVAVDVEVSHWGSENDKASRQMKTPEITFRVQVPPGAESVKNLLSTPGLTAVQRWKPDQNHFKVGDAIKRTIELNGRDISGMAFAPLHFESTESVSAYPAEPIVDDSFVRGILTGKRVETVTYVFAGEGAVELPEIAIPWWDIDKKKMQQTILPALQLDIAPSPTIAKGEAGSEKEHGQQDALLHRLGIASIILTALFAMAVIYRKKIKSRLTHWRQTRRQREAYYFKQFVRSQGSNDPKAAYTSLMRWIDHIHTGHGAARLDVFLQRYGDKKSLATIDMLLQALSKDKTDWIGGALSAPMKKARRRWLKARKNREAISSLPRLNP